MEQLNLPLHILKKRISIKKKIEIFDEFRKRFVVLTPEEWVRQQFLWFLVESKQYPTSLIAVEKGLTWNRMQKRFDAVVHNKLGQPVMLLEFKSTNVQLEQKTFDQVAVYNLQLRVKYLLISNGLQHFCCLMDYEKRRYTFLKEIPDFTEINNTN